ncbi:MAG: hypothetical protein Ct9H300mP21_03260 [Pseudomonadota bacterium]|nr:MAG: hypothetical protein Ct9H300mP21_03260 [Pseudomonadota bacterium]
MFWALGKCPTVLYISGLCRCFIATAGVSLDNHNAGRGPHVCLRKINAKKNLNSVAEHPVTHFCGAPIVMNMISNAPKKEQRELPHRVEIMTAAAPPPPTVIAQMEEAGFNVTHVYGLTGNLWSGCCM